MAIAPRYRSQVSGSPGPVAPNLPADFGQGGIGASLAQLGTEVAGAMTRIRDRNDAVARAKAENDFATFHMDSFSSLQTTADIADEQVLAGYGDTLRARQQEILANHKGSADSRAALEERLERERGRYLGQAIAASQAAGLAALEETAGAYIRRATEAVRSGTLSPEMGFRQVVDDLSDKADGFTPQQLQQQLRATAVNILSTAVERPLMGGDFDEAERLLERNPSAVELLGQKEHDRIRNRISTARQESTKIVREAQQKMAAFETLAGRKMTPQERGNAALAFAGITGVPEHMKGEFGGALNRLLTLEGEGKTDGTEYKMLAARLTRMTEGNNQGVAMSFNPETGEFTVMQGADPGGQMRTALGASTAIRQQEQLDRLNTVIGLVDRTSDIIAADPTVSGVVGSVRSFAQKVLGVAEDATPRAVVDAARRSVQSLSGVPAGDVEKLLGAFDPELPEVQIYENTLALELAKLRVLSGGGGIRAIESAFRAAQRDVAVTGLFSSGEASTRLATVRAEFAAERDKLQRRLESFSGVQAPTPAPTSGGGIPEGTTATGPGGARVILRNGQWEPM
jgi:hypothetical protein